MVVTEFFDHFASLDTTRWQSRVNGSGSVSVSDSTAILDEGGANVADVAALVLKEQLDFTRDWMFAVCLKVTGATTGAHSPNLVGIYNAAESLPDVQTQAQQNAAHRIYVENQMNITTVAFTRWQYRFKNPSGTVITWRNNTDDWNSAFQHSHTGANDDAYIILNIYHKVGSGIRITGYGAENGATGDNYSGLRLVSDTDWVDFGAGAGDIDAIDDQAFMVIGDLSNDAGGYQHEVCVEWARMHEVTGVREEVAYSAATIVVAFPFQYNIQEYVCPKGLIDAGHPLWIPAEHHPDDNQVVSRGSDHWVQDPYVYQHSDGTQYMVHNRRDTSGNGHIVIRSRASLGAAWSAGTDIISYNDAGLDAGVTTVRFPQLLYVDGTWWIFFSTEESSTPMRIWRGTTANSDPTVDAWGSLTNVLSESLIINNYDEDGVAQPFVYRLPDGSWQMSFAAYDDSIGSGRWVGAVATSTAVDGSWTKSGSNPIWPVGTAETQINGAIASDRVYNVDSSGSFSVGQPIVIGGQDGNNETHHRLTKVRSKPSDTQIEVTSKLTVADNQFVSGFHNFSIAPRLVRQAPDFNGLEMWATIFRLRGVETVGRFVSDVGDTDPLTATWTLSTDEGLPWIGLTNRPSDDFNSEENIGFILVEADIIHPASAASLNQRPRGMGVGRVGRFMGY